ncbi:MAG: DsrE family protein [Planctomycetia bacterium]
MARSLVLLAHSTEAPERASAALWLAQGLAQAGQPVDLWLYAEGVRLGVQHVAEAIQEPYPVGAAAALDALAAAGGTLWCARSCFEQRGFEADTLRPGARLGSPEDLARLLASGSQPLSL